MRIQILMLGFKGLTYPQFDYWEQLSESHFTSSIFSLSIFRKLDLHFDVVARVSFRYRTYL